MLTQPQIHGLRWAILRTVLVGGQRLGATDRMILDAARGSYLGVTRRIIRDEIAYLEKRKLVDVESSEVEAWRVTLTRLGRDLCDYVVDCDPGIARPPKMDREDFDE